MKYLVIIGLLSLCACATPINKRLNNLHNGMSKDEVIQVMGEPFSTKSKGSQDVLVYQVHKGHKEYWTILVNGKLTQFGAAGDFDSAIPAKRIIVEEK